MALSEKATATRYNASHQHVLLRSTIQRTWWKQVQISHETDIEHRFPFRTNVVQTDHRQANSIRNGIHKWINLALVPQEWDSVMYRIRENTSYRYIAGDRENDKSSNFEGSIVYCALYMYRTGSSMGNHTTKMYSCATGMILHYR